MVVVRALVLVVVLTARIALAEEAPPAIDPEPWRFSVIPEQWRTTIAPSDAVQVPRPITLDETIQHVSLKETIALALENNPRIAALRLQPLLVETNVLGAQAQFDPIAGGELSDRNSTTPNANVLSGTLTNVIEERRANATLSKLFRSGGRTTIDFLNNRTDNNAVFNQLRPQYSSQLNLSVVQPLLRDVGWDFSYLVVRSAERTAEAAFKQYEADLADFVTIVVAAYWNVVRARETLDVNREAMELADRTVAENEAREKVGLLAPVAVLEARADAKSREEQVIIAENGLAVARHELAQLVFYRPEQTFVPRTLEPSEEITIEALQIEQSQEKEALAMALDSRPEIIASSLGIEARQINERIARNQLLPRLDLVGSYGLNGLAGRNQPISRTATVSVFSATDTGGCISLGPGEGYLCEQPSTTRIPSSPYAGNRQDAIDRMSDFESYSFGLRLEVPLDNAQARSRETAARITRNQSELRHRQLLSEITLEVRRSLADAVSARQRIATSRVATELAEENLRNQQKRHEVGIATTKDLLDFQTRLTSARGAEVTAKLDYAIANARLRRATGTILRHFQIVLPHSSKRSTPWFAWF